MKFVIGHVLAGSVVIGGTLFLAFVYFVVGLATDRQGIDTPVAEIPAFLILMFMAGAFAVTVSTGSFLVSALLVWLRTKWRFAVWLPVVAIPLFTFVVVLLGWGASKGLDFVCLVTGLAFVYFGIYWLLLASSGAVLDFLRSRFVKTAA